MTRSSLLRRNLAALSLCATTLLGSVGPAGLVWAGSPLLNNLLPVAGQRGTEVRVIFSGERLHDTDAVLFHTPGLAFKDIEIERHQRVHATLVIAPDAPLGEHQVRLVTRTGVSKMVTFQVIDQPIVKEDEENNNAFDNAQPLEAGKVVLGLVTQEDVDYFSLDAKQGERLSIEINSMRLGRGMSDLSVALLDEDQFEVVSVDDTALLAQDPFVSLIVPEDGRYTIVVRDSAYRGGDNNWYLMKVGSFPRPTAVYPAGGQPGQQMNLRVVGDARGTFIQRITLPDRVDNHYRFFPEIDGQTPPSPHRLRVNNLTNVLEESYPRNNHIRHMESVAPTAAPVAFNGRITESGQQDFFKFSAKQGQKLRLNCYARALGSPLDPVINIFNAADNKHIAGNDDDRGRVDSRMDFDVPADGAYIVRVRDHLRRGGEDFVYRLEVGEQERALRTYLNENDRNAPQSRQAIAVPAGNRFATLIRVDRDRVDGDLDLSIDGLPEGVGYTGWCPNGRNEMPVVFEADHDSPTGYRIVDPRAATRSEADGERVVGGMRHAVPVIQANPNRTMYYASALYSLPVAVTQPAPFRIEADQPAAPLVRGGKKNLRINVVRDEGYEGRVRLFMLWRPPGLGAAGRVEVKPDQDHGLYEISAERNAATNRWPLAVIAFGEGIQGGSVWVSTQLFDVSVSEPFMDGRIDMAAVQQGQTGQVVVKLQHPQAWEGEAQLRLLGLPAETSVEPVTIKHGQEQAVFTVTTSQNTPVGQHKSLLCEIEVPVNGETSTHRFGMGGTLRIDRARPQPAHNNPAPQPNRPEERQLSRLEQLRLEAERERQGGE
ncbi:MAG: PPC domain-containing protein [Planctomycetota bacterium]